MREFSVFRHDPLTVVLGGRLLTVPWAPAADWCAAAEMPAVLAPRMLGPADRFYVAQCVADDRVGRDELQAASRVLLEAASGCPSWWEAERLIATSAGRRIYGRLILAGVDPHQVTLAAWCSATYALLAENRDTKDMLKLDLSLSVPPRGHEPRWDDGGDDPAEVQAALAKMMGG